MIEYTSQGTFDRGPCRTSSVIVGYKGEVLLAQKPYGKGRRLKVARERRPIKIEEEIVEVQETKAVVQREVSSAIQQAIETAAAQQIDRMELNTA
jgi:hypothetical protein